MTVAALVICSSASMAAKGSSSPEDDFETVVSPFLERHCFACHSSETSEAGLDLEGLSGTRQDAPLDEDQLDLWDYVRERVRAGDMPPRGSERPGEAERSAFLAWVDERVEPRDLVRDPGRPQLRRLNHLEYSRSVRDLLGLEFSAQAFFPADGTARGFRTASEALPLSELQLEKYIEAAELLAERAVACQETARTWFFGAGDLSGGRERGEGRVLITRGSLRAEVDLPRSGVYELRVRSAAQQAGDEWARLALEVDGKRLETFDVQASPPRAQQQRLRASLAGGLRRVEMRFLNDFYDPEHDDPARRDRNLHVYRLEVEGPLDAARLTPFQEGLLLRHPASLGEARLSSVLADLALRTWRRPVEGGELRQLEAFARAGSEGQFDRALRRALLRLFSSPHFLLRVEAPHAGPLNGYELATRLAGLVWSTTPDSELLELAGSGALTRSEVLRDQLQRLLADPRSEAMIESFTLGWLQLEALDGLRLDRRRFPRFEDLRSSMRREPLLVLGDSLREDRSLWDLLEGQYSFVDEALAKHYGLTGVEGPRYRRVSLERTPRRGLLGQAAVLAVTSDPTRTSPVKRGKWILDVLLGAAPPAPPPGADELPESDEAIQAASLRERLEQHRSDPSCAVCHQRMDPLGFGLENYDAMGRWRRKDGKHPIDASGVLPDGRSFEGPLELAAILREDDGFLHALCERFFIFAVGRGLQRSDRLYLAEIQAALDPEHPTLRQLIEAVVLSEPFRQRGTP